jgi:hypothetical protein
MDVRATVDAGSPVDAALTVVAALHAVPLAASGAAPLMAVADSTVAVVVDSTVAAVADSTVEAEEDLTVVVADMAAVDTGNRGPTRSSVVR